MFTSIIYKFVVITFSPNFLKIYIKFIQNRAINHCFNDCCKFECKITSQIVSQPSTYIQQVLLQFCYQVALNFEVKRML